MTCPGLIHINDVVGKNEINPVNMVDMLEAPVFTISGEETIKNRDNVPVVNMSGKEKNKT